MSVNRAILVGNLGRDPEVRRTGGAQLAVCNFTMATNEGKKDPSSGQWVNHTEWHKVVAFGRTAEFCEQYLKKGRQVYVEGRIRTRKWQDKEGKERYTTEILASNIQPLGPRDGATTAAAGRDNASGGYASEGFEEQSTGSSNSSLEVASDSADTPFDDDDIPF